MGMSFIPATELSCYLEGREIHVLAYFQMENLPKMSLIAEDVLEIKTDFDRKSVCAFGYSLKEYDAYEDDRSQGSWKLYHFIRDKGIVNTERQFFDLRASKIGEALFPHPEVLIRGIKESGGVPVLAHPSNYVSDGDLLAHQKLEQWMSWGIEGIESYFSYLKDPSNHAYYVDFCRKKGLFITAGSDFHGTLVTPRRKLGFPLPSINKQITVGDLVVR